MKLIKIEAHGFKSFADPIVLHFDGGVAGIVGPNGSGKSNINDAIRWVLGEQSSKELRGDNMEDVIFAGSKVVPAMDKATVTLTFDNSDRISSIQSDIITITRSLQRGKGINQYFLNGEPCRHKDIKAIAMESGIGKSSLAIISQGTVSEIAQSSDEARRLIFEEAAGVSKYKFRKEEALKKLDRTEITLKNIETVIREIEKQLEPLRKQAEKAIKYKTASEQLKNVEIAFLAHEIVRLSKVYEELDKELAGVEDTQNSYKNQIDNLALEIRNKKLEIKNIDIEVSKIKAKKDGINARLADLKVTQARENERRDLIAKGEILADSKEVFAALMQQIQETEYRKNYYQDTKNELSIKLTATRENLKNQQKEINDYKSKYNIANNKIASQRTHLDILKEKKNKRTNLFKGTRTIVENKANFKGFKGVVADLIKVEAKYNLAIETILNNAMQHIVVDKSSTAVDAVNFLKKNNGGRATFIPLATIKEKSLRDDYLFVLRNQPGFINVASELVDTQAEFNILKKFLLGNVVIVDNIKSAEKISEILENKYMVVTLEGDVIRVGGVIVGGTAQESDDLIGLDKKIEEIENQILGLEAIKKDANVKIVALESKLKSEESYERQYSAEFTAAEFHLKQELAQLDQLKSNASLHQDQEEKLNAKIELAPVIQRIQELENELRILDFDFKTKNQVLHDLREDLEVIEEKNSELNSLLFDLNTSFKSKIQEYENAKNNLQNYKTRLASFYELTLEYARENFSLNMSLESAKELIDELTFEIKQLGQVNLESIEELEQVEERYDSFRTNFEELTEARNTILGAIAEMDKIIITRLTNIVNDVNQEMAKVFSSMFGGGTAEVKFVDPTNILETGISIYAQPPGKSVKNLKLFSGGEKSLIAISLLFAILRARPLPLCILDEVEAALDEANVVRYGEYLQELKHQTQFLVITHRVGTMTKVDSLFGATMQRRGVTSFFSVKLEDAKKMVDPTNEIA